MRIRDISQPHPDIEHDEVLRQTGFWGKAAAGSIFLAKNTGRIGIAHRSPNVEQPGTWGTVGGAIDPGEDPQTAAIHEAHEEVGYMQRPGDYLIQIDIFQSGTFRYTTFLYVVEQEFQARLNWENQGFGFFEFGKWPQPLHFGLAGTLSKPECQAHIQGEIAKYRSA
jgi:8-oxo-dGTP pyrophosphatase MutT (NUDIX family)